MAVLIDGQAVKTVFKTSDPSARPLQSIPALVQSVRKSHPGGVNLILVGVARANLFKVVENQNGIIAVLIGMLLPAVQKTSMPNSVDAGLLETALKSGGSLGFVTSDGSARSTKPAGRRVIDCEGFTY